MRLLLLGLSLVLLSSPVLAQGNTGDRFCRQYANRVTEIAADAIARNHGCLDYSKGVHTQSKMHYDWCMRNSRNTVHGAAEHIQRLARRCTAQKKAPGGGNVLGRVWHERESGWQGIWRRVGGSNKFKAEWTHPGGGVVRANLTINVRGNNVTVLRRDTYGSGVGKGCKYTGVRQGKNVRGHYSCDWARGPIPWSAQIR